MMINLKKMNISQTFTPVENVPYLSKCILFIMMYLMTNHIQYMCTPNMSCNFFVYVLLQYKDVLIVLKL